jgi:hypothetical protein
MTHDSLLIARRLFGDIGIWSTASARPLRAYQAECARAIVRSVIRREGRTFTVMFARQMGKNETSAQLEAYLLALYAGRGGSMVKAAPSFKPQIVTSMLRLKDTLNAHPLTRGRWQPAYSYMMRLDQAQIAFFSAQERANVVGATASLLLEIDEAQDVDPEKYDRELRPMASSTNATTVLYGTAWSEDSLLERQKRLNLEHEGRTGERLHFEYDWTALAALNPHYDRFVRAEFARLGGDHPSVRTQYLLHCLADAGRLFSDEQRRRLRGMHERERAPRPGVTYIAGIDIAGSDEDAEDAAARALKPKRDSTVITVAALERDDSGRPAARVVEQIWWTGRDHTRQLEGLEALWRIWSFARVSVDAGGIGHGLARFLAQRFGERVDSVVFTQPLKSRLAYGMLGMINTGRLSLYAPDGSPEARQCWWEIEHTRYHLKAGETLVWSVPDSEGHDDFVVSLALCARAAESAVPPAAGRLKRAEPTADDRGW